VLALLSGYERRRIDGLLYAAALAVAAAALTRAVGAVLFGPLALVALRAPRRVAVLAFAIALMPMLLWYALHRSAVGYAESLYTFYGGNIVALIEAQLRIEAPAMADALTDTFLLQPAHRWVVFAIAAASLCATAYRALRRKPDAVYLAAVLGVVLLWPFDPNDTARFLWVLLPVAMAQPILCLAQLRGSCAQAARQPAVALFAAAVLALGLPTIAFAADRYRAAADSGIPGVRGLRHWYDADPHSAARRASGEVMAIDMMRRIGAAVPPDACVVSIRPDLINYFAGRMSSFPPIDAVAEPDFSRMLHAAHCRYAFLTTASYSGYPEPLYPLKRIADTVDIVDYGEIPQTAAEDGKIIVMVAKFR
jgi:hypothetical protein